VPGILCKITATRWAICTVNGTRLVRIDDRLPMDPLDAHILETFATEPRIGVLEASRRLGVARGTVQARLDRLAGTGVVRGWGPEVDPAAMGFGVTAFVTLEIRQGRGAGRAHDAVAAHLAAIPEVLEAHTITGGGDMLARIVARSNADLQRVIDLVVAYDGIVRTSTVIALDTQIAYRTLPLVKESATSRHDQ
jgi:DNA-binding Lrp family transcriptional regulator